MNDEAIYSQGLAILGEDIARDEFVARFNGESFVLKRPVRMWRVEGLPLGFFVALIDDVREAV